MAVIIGANKIQKNEILKSLADKGFNVENDFHLLIFISINEYLIERLEMDYIQ